MDNGDTSYRSANQSTSSRTLNSSFMSSSSVLGSFTQRSNAEKEETYANPVVATKEQKAVFFARVVVVMVLVIALAIVTSIMYWVVARNERKEFESQFETFASEISSSVEVNYNGAIKSAEAFSTMVTSSANAFNQSWPFVSIMDYTSKAKRLSDLSGAYQITFAPIVYAKNFTGWADHSVLNLPTYYEEAIKVLGYNVEVANLIAATQAVPWAYNPNNESFVPTDPLEPEIPIQLVGLRERIGFDGFFVNWQTLDLLGTIIQGYTITNLNLLYAGFEDAFATAYEFNIPAFDSYRNPVYNMTTGELTGFEMQTQMVQPIFDTIYNGEGSRMELKMVGALLMLFDWESLLSNLLSEADIRDVDIVLESTCSLLARPVTYRVTDKEVVELGPEDLHDESYDELGVRTPLFVLNLDDETQSKIDEVMALQIGATTEGGCVSEMFMSIYPTSELEDSFYTDTAWHLSGGVAAVFVFTSFIFFLYDVMVKRRQEKVMERIIRQDKIVLNTFPKAIRDKLYRDSSGNDLDHSGHATSPDNSEDNIFGSGQIADLYPCATVVFADIVGFTAWSSAREPNQVFKLLETIYKEFDKLAYRHDVFKVETVGDCYVAVAGVPEDCDDHALAVARFSRDIMHKMRSIVRRLEILLGPGTADLQLRIGINSGQVTAGVLRGDKARFQLFGDTVNTASRMETSSRAGCIHVSPSSAEALKKAGRDLWLKTRQDTVFVKGKGQMQTYYLETLDESIQRSKLRKYKKRQSSTEATNLLSSTAVISEEEVEEGEEASDHLHDDFSEEFDQNMSKSDRLVEWNVEILGYLIKQIMVARPENVEECDPSSLTKLEDSMRSENTLSSTVLDEFQEIIELPSIGTEELLQRKHPDTITLSPVVVNQLRDLLKAIASMYNENPFHNFEHASHVTASVRKLLTRIVEANHHRKSVDDKIQNGHELKDLSGHSYGITSDPLTQFAVVFSAVIHDADHPGVPNAQLLMEKTRIAQIYRKSIAEQNSVELVWELLMSSAYADLRSCIYSSEDELKRFRQLVVNAVMATDIVDKELQNLRKMRWENAFSFTTESKAVSTPKLDINRKATIVIEHLIQASDVSHTMQHWKIYRKWNERFFFEQYDAYKNGRAEKDPLIDWYKGEIGFFDLYVIPLAKKLESCGVFGVSSDEYLGYAQSNRDEWVREGEQVVKEFLENYHEAKDPSSRTIVI